MKRRRDRAALRVRTLRAEAAAINRPVSNPKAEASPANRVSRVSMASPGEVTARAVAGAVVAADGDAAVRAATTRAASSSARAGSTMAEIAARTAAAGVLRCRRRR